MLISAALFFANRKNFVGDCGRECRMMVRELVCGKLKCRKPIGKIVDEQYLEIGSARFYLTTRFSCECGRLYSFKPIEPDDELSDEGQAVAHKILSDLAVGSKATIRKL
jgi:hypothetical protein